MTRHGACIGPVGARLHHDACPGVIQTLRGQQPCECSCHERED